MPALVLFASGLALRVLFCIATPDGGPGWHVGFQGDAPVWQDFAARLQAGTVDDPLRLPMRPPGMQWLVALLWNGDAASAWPVRALFLVLGAATAPLLWFVLRRHVAPAVAFAAAALCAAAGNLLLLSSGLHVETIYLTLVLAALLLQPRLTGPRPRTTAAAWGLLQGLLCLLRAEHVLTAIVWLMLARLAGAAWRTTGIVLLAAAGVLAPWQWHANAVVDAYNDTVPQLPPPSVPWDPDALAALRALPGFHQLPTLGFVSDTVRVRGGTHVRAADLAIVQEAYGVVPEPLPHGFVAIYGPLNFFLGNSPEADGGFSTNALNRPPPLTGGDARYPPGLRRVLPRSGSIAFDYPPHADRIAHGMARGLAELTADPAAAAARLCRKLWHAVEGATGGVGGYALPIGMSGVRRQVDLVTATGTWANVYRALVLAVAAAGWWRLRHIRALWPLAAFAATRIVVVAAYFGYARQGALCLPLVALGIAAAVHAAVAQARARAGAPKRWLLPLLLGLVVAAETARCFTTDAFVDGQPAARPQPLHDFQLRRVEFR